MPWYKEPCVVRNSAGPEVSNIGASLYSNGQRLRVRVPINKGKLLSWIVSWWESRSRNKQIARNTCTNRRELSAEQSGSYSAIRSDKVILLFSLGPLKKPMLGNWIIAFMHDMSISQWSALFYPILGVLVLSLSAHLISAFSISIWSVWPKWTLQGNCTEE